MGYKIATGFVEIKLGDESVFVRAAQSAVNRVASQAQQTLSSRIGNAINSLGEKFTHFGHSAALYMLPLEHAFVELTKQGWNLAKEINTNTNMFKQFGLSTKQSAGFMSDLYNLSNKWGTDYETNMQTARRMMASYEGDINKVKYALNGMANLSGKLHLGTTQINSMTYALNEMLDTNKVNTREMSMLGRAIGMNAWKLFSDATGKSQANLRQMAQQGKLLGSDVLPQVFKYLNTNPDFAGKAIAQSKTLQGQLVIMHNQLKYMFAKAFMENDSGLTRAFQNLNMALSSLINSGVVTNFFTPLINAFAKLMAWIAKLTPAQQAFGAKLLIMGAVMGPVAIIIGKILKLFSTMFLVTGKVGQAFRTFADNCKLTNRDIAKMAPILRGIDAAMTRVNRVLQGALSPITALRVGWLSLKAGIQSAASAIASRAVSAFQRLKSGASLAVTGLRVFASEGLDKVRAAATRVGDVVRNPITAMRLLGQAAKEAATGGVARLRSALSSGFSKSCDLAARGLKKVTLGAAGLAKGAVKSIPGLGALKGGLSMLAFAAVSMIASGQDLGPAIDQLTNQIVSFINNLPQAINQIAAKLPGVMTKLINAVVTNLPKLIQAFATAVPKIVNAFVTVFPKLISGIQQALPKILQAFAQMIPKIITALTTLLPMIVSAFAKVIPMMVNGIVSMLPTLISGFVNMIPPIVNALAAALPAIVMCIANAIPQIVTAVVNALPSIVNAFVSAIPKIVTALLGALPAIVTTFANSIPKIVTALVNAFPKIVTAFVNAIPKIVNALVANLPKIVTAFVKCIPQTARALIGAIPQLVSAIVKAIPAMASALVSAGHQLFNAGVQIMKSMLSGITSMFGSIASSVGSFISGLNPFKSAAPKVPVRVVPHVSRGGLKGLAPLSAHVGLLGAGAPGGAAPVAQLGAHAQTVSDAMGQLGTMIKQKMTQDHDHSNRQKPKFSAQQTNNITVNANTNANAFDISREIAWQLKTSGR
ncbi:tape measure protein [Streptomyces albulus]|nr:tape measure protein [Streptomyces noursei]